MDNIRVFAHNDDDESDWFGEQEAKRLGAGDRKTLEIRGFFESKPLYEICVEFDPENFEPVALSFTGGKRYKLVADG